MTTCEAVTVGTIMDLRKPVDGEGGHSRIRPHSAASRRDGLRSKRLALEHARITRASSADGVLEARPRRPRHARSHPTNCVRARNTLRMPRDVRSLLSSREVPPSTEQTRGWKSALHRALRCSGGPVGCGHIYQSASKCAVPFPPHLLHTCYTLPSHAGSSLDVPVVHDGKTLVSHGPPSSWAPGVAQRVQNGALQLGMVRVRLAVEDDAGSKAGGECTPPALPSAPPLAARRLAARRLKVGVHADRGGLEYMEDENVVHTTADFAFFCVYDGHGGTPMCSKSASR